MTAVERVHALWAAWERGGLTATLEHVDEGCEWMPSADLPDPRLLRGSDEVRDYLDRLRREGTRFEPALHTFEALDEETVLVGGRMRVVSRAALSDSPLFWLYRTDGERVVRVESFASREDALTAASA